MFYDKKCTISSVVISISGNREVKTPTVVYEEIECDFYPPTSNGYYARAKVKEYSSAKYEVVLPGKYDQVRRGMEIELFDLGSQGKFIIDSLIAYRLPSGTIDNITLQVNLMDAGSE